MKAGLFLALDPTERVADMALEGQTESDLWNLTEVDQHYTFVGPYAQRLHRTDTNQYVLEIRQTRPRYLFSQTPLLT